MTEIRHRTSRTGCSRFYSRRVDCGLRSEPADGWPAGRGHASWLNPPPHVASGHDDLLVTAAEGSDLWRTTSYGFIHETGTHAMLADFPDRAAAEVTFVADFPASFDRAGLLVRVDAR